MIEIHGQAVKTFADNVRRLRQAKGISIWELAEASTVPIMLLEQLDMDVLHKRFYVYHLFALCDILEVTPHEVLQDTTTACENPIDE